jgi:hypothetical protein
MKTREAFVRISTAAILLFAIALYVRPAAASPGGDSVTAVIVKPQAGDNNLKITLKSPQGKPIIGAKIAASVAMESMDMGTTTPPVKEVGHGVYTSKVNFNMSGPWAVTLHIAPGNGKPFKRTFDFNAN